MLAPGYIFLTDQDGTRHLIRVSAIQFLSDADQCRDSTVITISGRPIVTPVPLDDLVMQLHAASRPQNQHR